MKYNSEIAKVMHQDAKEMHKIGAITKERMREYDEMCLKNFKTKKTTSVHTEENPVDIKTINHATA